MRKMLVLAILLTLAPLAGAEVIRCTDATGKVSYTDSVCPAGARPVGRVAEPPPATPADVAAESQRREENAEAIRARPLSGGPAPAPSGPAIIDSRGNSNSNSAPATESRWSDRGDDPAVVDLGYGYPGAYPGAYPGGYRQPRPPRDMRAPLRYCDATGCRDTIGNHFDRAGRVDRYQGIDGKSCRPVGTTTICR